MIGLVRGSVVMACSASEGAIDAIRDQTLLLADALGRDGIDVEVRMRRGDGTWVTRDGGTLRRLDDDLDGVAALVLAYQPFLYGRWGFSPWLPLALLRLRRRRDRPLVALYVHERPVPPRNWRWLLMGTWQRAELRGIQRSTDLALVTIPAWRRSLQRRLAEKAVHVPVGSSLPDLEVVRTTHASTLVLTLFGTAQPVRRLDHAVGAANAVAATGRAVTILHLGAGATPLSGLDERIDVQTPGELALDELARRLAETDVFLAPFTDGVSTRRTTVMAALQQGLAVVGTDGFLTDDVLRTATTALRLVPAGDGNSFAAAVLELCQDPARREAMGRAAAALYRAEFDWPVAARRVVTALESSK